MMNRDRTNKRPTAPKLVRQVARTAGLSLEELAKAVMDGQPEPPTAPEAEAMMRRLIETERKARPGIDGDALASNVQERVRELIGPGDPVVAALSEQLLNDFLANRARVVIALMGAGWHPSAPVVPKPARIEAIANTVFSVTRSARVGDETIESIYRWLFGDEALFVNGTEMRVEAGLVMPDNHDPSPVRVPHLDTGELVLVTREESWSTQEAAHRYTEKLPCIPSRLRPASPLARQEQATPGGTYGPIK